MAAETSSANSFVRGMKRIMVVGAACSGKSTLARCVSEQLDMPHVEFDGLFWNPGWNYAPENTVRERLRSATSGNRWLLDGNCLEFREIVWPRADTVVWLDYPMGQVLWWALRRTFARCWTRELLWSNNVESFQRTFFCQDSFLLWATQNWRKRRRDYSKLLRQSESRHLQVFQLRSLEETQEWLGLLQASDDGHGAVAPTPLAPYKRAG